MEDDIWASEPGRKASRQLLRMLAEQGPPGRREIARDVLEGRHSLRDLAYLPNMVDDDLAGVRPLLDRWQQASDEEREEAASRSDDALRRVVSTLVQLHDDSSDNGPPEVDDEAYFANDEFLREVEDPT